MRGRLVSLKPRAVCEAFRSCCCGFSRRLQSLPEPPVFVREANRGTQFRFFPTREQAAAWLETAEA